MSRPRHDRVAVSRDGLTTILCPSERAEHHKGDCLVCDGLALREAAVTTPDVVAMRTYLVDVVRDLAAAAGSSTGDVDVEREAAEILEQLGVATLIRQRDLAQSALGKLSGVR